MRGELVHGASEEPNPYIALADLCINLILVLVLCVAVVFGMEEARVKPLQQQVEDQIHRLGEDSPKKLPREWRNDPVGDQRWVYEDSSRLFEHGTPSLTPEGERRLGRLGAVLSRVLTRDENAFRRVRIEGHTRPTENEAEERSNLELSALRAIRVAEVLRRQGIEWHRLAFSGRGGQSFYEPQPDHETLQHKAKRKANSRNERVEIIIEYASEEEGTP